MRRFQLQMIDGKELINFEWSPSKPPIAVIQIILNIDEHMSMYDNIAKIFNKFNILVIGTDLRGIGESVENSSELGIIGKRQGWNTVIEDIRTVNTFIRRTYLEIPIFLLGQTIGADFSTAYAIKYCETIDGLILVGSKNHQSCRLLFKLPSAYSKSNFLPNKRSNYFFKNLNKAFECKKNSLNRNAWISNDERFVEYFSNDILQNSLITNKMKKDILAGQFFISLFKNLNLIEKDLPILILSGIDDAYTKFSKNSRKLFSKFVKLGNNVDFKIYEKSRNRLLNDLNKLKVVDDIVSFINKNIK